jgi:retron-type reverse transcriptase
VEPVFHEDSYGYRPGRSPVDAVAVCRERCFRKDWVVDLDIRAKRRARGYRTNRNYIAMIYLVAGKLTAGPAIT